MCCVICLEDYADKEKVVELDCNDKHLFHMKCMEEWVVKNDICPMCRVPIIKGSRPSGSSD